MFDEMVEQLRADRPAFLASFGKIFFGQSLMNHPVSQEILDWMQGLALQGSPRATTECLISFSRTDFREEMADVKIPALVIHGDADKTVPIQPTGDQAARLIPGAVYKKYDGSPHGLFITDKEELAADLIQFIKKGSVEYNFAKTGEPPIPEMMNPVWP
jgi:non-heme chloroperoxidase